MSDKPTELYEGASGHPGTSANPVQRGATGDGAVVREWTWKEGLRQVEVRGVGSDERLGRELMVREHNAAMRCLTAEIERLTREQERLDDETAGHMQALRASTADLLKARPIITVKTMELSGDRREYFVSIVCEDREVTPHKFNEQFKAEYEAAFYRFVFGQGAEPDMLAYSNAGWPAIAETA